MDKRKSKTFLPDTAGSLTVEALLIIPIMILLLAVFIRWGLVLREDLQENAEKNGISSVIVGQIEADSEPKGTWFLYGGRPARRIRDADTLIDLGKMVTEQLPKWFQGGD